MGEGRAAVRRRLQLGARVRARHGGVRPRPRRAAGGRRGGRRHARDAAPLRRGVYRASVVDLGGLHRGRVLRRDHAQGAALHPMDGLHARRGGPLRHPHGALQGQRAAGGAGRLRLRGPHRHRWPLVRAREPGDRQHLPRLRAVRRVGLRRRPGRAQARRRQLRQHLARRFPRPKAAVPARGDAPGRARRHRGRPPSQGPAALHGAAGRERGRRAAQALRVQPQPARGGQPQGHRHRARAARQALRLRHEVLLARRGRQPQDGQGGRRRQRRAHAQRQKTRAGHGGAGLPARGKGGGAREPVLCGRPAGRLRQGVRAVRRHDHPGRGHRARAHARRRRRRPRARLEVHADVLRRERGDR